MSELAKWYRQRAAECRADAADQNRPEAYTFLELSQQYEKMAYRLERTARAAAARESASRGKDSVATGQIEEKPEHKDPKAVTRGAKGGATGGKARAAKLTRAQRAEFAKI